MLINTQWPPDGTTGSTGVAALIGQIDHHVHVHKPEVDIGPDGTMTMTGALQLDSLPARTELVSGLFPSFRFVFAGEADWKSDFRLALGPGGELMVQIDTLPLEVLLPADFLGAHPEEGPDEIAADISLAEYSGYSTIKRTFSLKIEDAGTLRLEPHLPISIGPCRLIGIPMNAVHDLTLIAAPGRAFKLHDWIVRPLDAGDFPPEDGGGIGFGGIEIDWEAENSPLADLRKSLSISEDAELVIEDVVLPAIFSPPVPRHGTLGLRRCSSRGSRSRPSDLRGCADPVPAGQFGAASSSTSSISRPRRPERPDPGAQSGGRDLGAFGDDGQNDRWDFSLA